ncbi:flagellar hook assembly protein FlgD [Vibrio sp.]|nr:flagellar hook assembly protein FlgD [Vibrio sp.]
MSVSSIGSQINLNTSESAPVSGNPNSPDELKNDFLTMMVAQIQNQDPLNPADGTEYVSQLAQFSQVQSSETLVQLMEDQASLLSSLHSYTTAGLVDQNVYVRTNTFNSDVDHVKGEITLLAPSSQVNVNVTNEFGETKNYPLGYQRAGTVPFELNMIDADMAGSRFTVNVELSKGQNYIPDLQLQGKVNNIDVPKNGSTSIVNIAGLGSVPLYDIAKFGGQSQQEED